jgi:ABC-type glycerol-3-phosphate transport system permease component
MTAPLQTLMPVITVFFFAQRVLIQGVPLTEVEG